jgi:hypothetical protein
MTSIDDVSSALGSLHNVCVVSGLHDASIFRIGVEWVSMFNIYLSQNTLTLKMEAA